MEITHRSQVIAIWSCQQLYGPPRKWNRELRRVLLDVLFRQPTVGDIAKNRDGSWAQGVTVWRGLDHLGKPVWLYRTDAKKQGVDSMALLGHKSESVHQRYLRCKDIPLVQGIKKVAKS
jgi:hypothetical protein